MSLTRYNFAYGRGGPKVRLRILFALLCLPSLALAQQQAPVRLCIANFRNETPRQFELPKFRDMLVSQLKLGNLARNHRLAVLPLNGDTDESAAPEVRDNHCDFVSFQRFSMFKVANATRSDSLPFPTIAPTMDKEPLPGIQFTVVRVQSGMPILIDRRIAKKPFERESDALSLLQPVSDGIQLELEKRLLGKPAN